MGRGREGKSQLPFETQLTLPDGVVHSSMIGLRLPALLMRATPYLLIATSVVGIVHLQQDRVHQDPVSKTLTDYQKEENETARQVSLLHRMPAIGFDNLIADWIYLNFIQYFGDTEARQKTGYSLLPDYLAGVVKRDPHFVEALILIEVGNSLFAGLPQQSVALLEQALEQIQPKFISRLRPYYLWRYKGNNELLFLGDVAQAKKSYQKSIEWAAVYDDQDSRKIQAISQKSLASLNKNSGSKSARIGAWVNILSNTPDPKTVDRVIQEIEQLGGEVTLLAGGRITVKVPDEDR